MASVAPPPAEALQGATQAILNPRTAPRTRENESLLLGSRWLPYRPACWDVEPRNATGLAAAGLSGSSAETADAVRAAPAKLAMRTVLPRTRRVCSDRTIVIARATLLPIIGAVEHVVAPTGST